MQVFSLIYLGLNDLTDNTVFYSGEITEEIIREMSPFSDFIENYEPTDECWVSYSVFEWDDGSDKVESMSENYYESEKQNIFSSENDKYRKIKKADIFYLTGTNETYSEGEIINGPDMMVLSEPERLANYVTEVLKKYELIS